MENIKQSKGNYDCLMGIITEYDYSMDAQGAYECTTVVSSIAWLFEGADYQNQTIVKEGKNQEETQLESFKEFITSSGLDSEKVKKYDKVPALNGRFFRSKNQQDNTASNKKWIRFDYFIEVINHFFSMELDGVKMHKFVIDDVLISAHPGIKSIDINVLVPNQMAPQYIPVGKEKSKSSVISTDGEVGELFKDAVLPSLSKGNLAKTYDNLFELLNVNSKTGNPFPLLKVPSTFDNKGYYQLGYIEQIKK
jgi:hypothetical protein